jgi:DNA-binding CsgD family transcriptional regulator
VLELPPAAPLVMAIDGLAQRARLGPLPVAPPGDVPTPDAPPAFDLGLTAREREVLALLGRGRTNSEIGEALVISPKTASVHVTNIMRKLGVGRRVEAAAVAHRVGLANATPAPAH